jgi:hypothetical protein
MSKAKTQDASANYGADVNLIADCQAWASETVSDAQKYSECAHEKPRKDCERMQAALDRIIATPAQTLSGLKAKAELLKVLDYNHGAMGESLCDGLMEYQKV